MLTGVQDLSWMSTLFEEHHLKTQMVNPLILSPVNHLNHRAGYQKRLENNLSGNELIWSKNYD